MNMLYGLLRPDEGEIRIGGRAVHMRSSADAIRLGIGMVHQHFMLVPVLTVAENIVLGDEPQHRGMLDMPRGARSACASSRRARLRRRPARARAGRRRSAPQQRVEILKALYRDAGVLILDEPTAVLTPQEIDELWPCCASCARAGTSIIFITHKLDEVLRDRGPHHRHAARREGRHDRRGRRHRARARAS